MSPTRPFRFALQVRGLDDADAITTSVRRAVELGVEEVYSFDHVGTVDPFVPLMVAAAADPTVRVGPLVIDNELHHPVLLARTAATVDRLTGGRLVLGLGTGYSQSEHDAAGIELRPPAARVDRFGESLAVLRALLDDGAVHLDGEHVRVQLDDLGVRPAQARVPLLVGGFGRRVVSLAARYADVFQFTGLVHGPGGELTAAGFGADAVARRAAWLSEDAGDRDASIVRSALVQHVEIGPDARSRLPDLAARFEIEEDVLAGSPFVLVGSVEQIVDELETQRERLGIHHLVIRDVEAMAPVIAALRGR